MLRYVAVFAFFASLFASSAEQIGFDGLFACLPANAGMLICVEDYKSLRRNDFRRRIVQSIISGKPASFSDDTRQINKLDAKMQALEQAAGFRFKSENLDPMIGGKIAVAFYGVGDVEFVYVTKLPATPHALQSPRSWYEEQQRGDIKYWTAQKERQGGWGGFFIHEGYLVISNSQERFDFALALAAGDNKASISTDDTTMLALKYCRFSSDNGQAAVVINTTILSNDDYYARYYQGVPPERQKFSRVSFGFDFHGEEARILRASIPHKSTNISPNTQMPVLTELCPHGAIAFEEFAPSNNYEAIRRFPMLEHFLPHDGNAEIERGACVWIAIDSKSDIYISPLILLALHTNAEEWFGRYSKRIIAEIEKDAIEGYKPFWKKHDSGKFYILTDAIGSELGFAYAAQGTILALASRTEIMSQYLQESSSETKKLFRRSRISQNGFGAFAVDGSKLTESAVKYLEILEKRNLIDSYSARRFAKEFIIPIALNSISNIDYIASVETNMNNEYLLTRAVLKLK